MAEIHFTQEPDELHSFRNLPFEDRQVKLPDAVMDLEDDRRVAIEVELVHSSTLKRSEKRNITAAVLSPIEFAGQPRSPNHISGLLGFTGNPVETLSGAEAIRSAQASCICTTVTTSSQCDR